MAKRAPSPASEVRRAEAIARVSVAEARAAAAVAEATAHASIAETVTRLSAGTYANARRNRLRPGPAPRGGAADYHIDTTDRTKLRA